MAGGTLEPAGKPGHLRVKDEQTPAGIYEIFSKLKKSIEAADKIIKGLTYNHRRSLGLKPE